ncbi:MAG: Glu-tRNA(Gln) amidotransferase subunit GatE [bacterium]
MSSTFHPDVQALYEPLPQYGTFSAEDYQALGLKVGLEIHQQLLTSRKLFCRCPAGLYGNSHDAEILRHMRPTLSEMGEYDGTALMEFKTQKDIIYQLDNRSVCTYEMDDAPPFELNQEALEKAVAIALLLGCKMVGEIHITRKQYLDGSIPTGFQRTTIVGVDGVIPFRGRQVGIQQLGLEEDSCREVSDRGHVRTYRTDRLGMPLIETVTDCSLQTPEEAAAVGQILRRLVRLTGLVRTGSGAARQDVNVSIEGSTRIEIKGVPSLRAIPRLIHNEMLRQRSLLAIRDLLRNRGLNPGAIQDRFSDVTGIVRSTRCRFIAKAVSKGAVVSAVPLPGFEGLLSVPTQPHTTFLREFADRVRVIACIDDLPNLACSIDQAVTLSSGEWDKVSRACNVPPTVPIVVVWGRSHDVETACREIHIRAREATEGVPSETRQALQDGTNGFERILPGPDRMYPDTDLPPIKLEPQLLNRIEADLPEPQWQREAQLRELGVGGDLANRLACHPADELFRHLVPQLAAASEFTPNSLASLLLDRTCPRPPDLDSAGAWWEDVIARLLRGELVPEGIWSGDGTTIAALDEPEGRQLFENLLQGIPETGPPDGELREIFVMGHVMQALRGRIAGQKVRRWVKEALH